MYDKLPTLILRMITILSAIAGILLCVFALPSFATAIAKNYPAHAFWQYPILVGVYAAALCFFYALVQFWLFLNGIDRNHTLSAKNLAAIRLSAALFGVLYFLSAMPVFFLFAEADDAPGVILVGAFVGMLPIGVAAAAKILERLLAGTQTGEM